ncbi:MAG: hypothetical protein MJ137_01285 [Clostridia bacterium]|nr:hypothetical protein [Clostridia bacterium]
MKKILRLMTASLAIIMLLSAISCAKNPDTSTTDPADSTNAPAVNTADETTLSEAEKLNPNLPALDWNGNTFFILYNGNDLEPNLDFVAEEITGAILNDAVYNRNLFIANKHHLVIDSQYKADGEIVTLLTNSNSSGDDPYQLVEVNQSYSMSLAIKGLTTDFSQLTNVNLDKPYWNANLLSGSSIYNKNFFAYSDANVHAFGATPCTIFNKSVLADHNLGDIYKLVTDGNWTHETMSEMVKKVTADKDGDGKITKDDYLGMIANTFCIDCFVSGSGYQMMSKDEEDFPTLNIQDEKFYNIIDSIKNLCDEKNGMFLVDRTSTSTEAREYWTEHAITENRALFWIGNFKCVERLRVSDCDFGVVPIPKVDKDQDDYKIHMQANIGAAMNVPRTVQKLADVSTILEDIAYQSYLTVMPNYMEVLILGQSIRDVDSLVCINIIRNSYYCDMGFMLGNYGISILGAMRDVVKDNTDVVTSVKTQVKKFDASIKNIKKAFVE